MVNGHMCCGLTKTALMVRVGPNDYELGLAQPHARPMDFTGRPLKGFVYVDPAGYATDTALAKWVQRAVDFVSTQSVGQVGSRTSRKRPPDRAHERRAKRSK
jgi:hypothetical protein